MSLSTLRSLCLATVSTLFPHLSSDDLPASLTKELAKIHLFCGNFVNTDVQCLPRNSVDETALTVGYDGITWTFSFRSQFHFFECCYTCNYTRPDIVTFSIKEKVPSPFCSPFWLISNCMYNEKLLAAESTSSQSLLMTMAVDIKEDGSYGWITFKWRDGVVKYKSTIKVRVTDNGTRILTHKSWVTSAMRGVQWVGGDRLHQTDVAAKDAFPGPVPGSNCTNDSSDR